MSFGIILIITMSAFLGYSHFIVPNLIKVKFVNIPLGFNKKIVHISDLHFNKNSKTKKIIRIIKKNNPDWIFITGDLVGNVNGKEKVNNFIKDLEKISKVFIVLGNWDYNFNFKTEKAMINSYQRVGDITIAGIRDPHTSKDITKDLKAIGITPNILLAHSPDVIKYTKDIDLIVTGHTHGGQIYIPFLSRLILPIKDKKYMKGYYKEGNTHIYVNPGLGTSTLPLRFLVSPEITVIELKKD